MSPVTKDLIGLMRTLARRGSDDDMNELLNANFESAFLRGFRFAHRFPEADEGHIRASLFRTRDARKGGADE